MRVTCDAGSDDFWPLIFSSCPDVYLDGRYMKGVRAADDVAGWVEHYGKFRVCDCGQRGVVELAFGRVEIRGSLRSPRIVPGARS
ncbi:hypothetical protein PMI42_00729 [Bradyrhizobium sp. YR681]|nr:hypothetical protein PMI42_00729 [Bradyrhizobium sp. YR681]